MSRKPQEVELRLATTDEAARKLRKSTALASLAVSSWKSRRLVSVYWDTPDFHLRGAQLALRLRCTDGGGWVQTLKAETQDPETREEYEASITGTRPDLELAHRLGWRRDASLLALKDELQPMFCTRVVRTVRTLRFDDGTVAELSLDRGELSVESGQTSPERIIEIEIELVTGSACRLYELASRLVAELPSTRLLFASKSQRGYELLTGSPSPPRHAQEIEIRRKAAGAQVAYRAAAESLVHVQRNVECARAGRDSEAIHQMRIGVRRLRVTAAIARKAGLPSYSDKLGRELRWLWQLLGETRDWDVFETETWPDAKRSAGRYAESTAAFDAAVADFRKASHRKLRRALADRRFQFIVLALGWINTLQREAMASASGELTAKQLARQLLSQRAKRTHARVADVDRLTDDQRHRLRIDAKKLRYLAEFFTGLYAPRATRLYLRRLAAVQTALGRLNDLTVTAKLIRLATSGLPATDRSLVTAMWERHASSSASILMERLGEKWKGFATARRFWE
jgi:triphosphatase